MEIKPEDTLSPLFLEDKDNYVIKLEKTDKGTFINGKTEEETVTLDLIKTNKGWKIQIQ